MSEETKQKEFSDLVPAPENTEVLTSQSLIDVGSDLAKSVGDEMGRVGFENLKKLCLQKEFVIGDKTYTGKKLTPKDIREWNKLEKDAEDFRKTTNDIETLENNEMAVLKTKAFIHLGMSEEDFEETDIPMLSQVITARELRKRGWFQL